MNIVGVFTTLLLIYNGFAVVLPDPEQFALRSEDIQSLDEKNNSVANRKPRIPKSIAIIGSGMTGATTAFRLYEGYRSQIPADDIPSITVFERNTVVGGRVTQAYVFNDQRLPIDTCAATFSQRDQCIANAVASVGLSFSNFESERPQAGTGVWDGQNFVGFVEYDGFRDPINWSLYRKVKWYVRYGNTPWDFQQNVSSIRSRYDAILRLPFFQAPDTVPLRPGQADLSEQVKQAVLGGYEQNLRCFGPLEGLDGQRASQFLREVVYPSERERFFGEVFDFNTLEFYLSFENQFGSSVRGGNLRLIERLLKLSSADVRLNTEVSKAQRLLDGATRLTFAPSSGGIPLVQDFDRVVLASSLDLANLIIEPPVGDLPGLKQKYKNSFVTHFTTTGQLNPSFFNRRGTMPQNVFTVAGKDSNATDPAGPPFLSLTLLKQLRSPDQPQLQNLYKLVSRERIPPQEILNYLEGPRDGERPVITWIDQQPLPKSVPVSTCESNPDTGEMTKLLERIEIAPGIYYAGAGEQVAATADFGCRMAANVVDLILAGEQG